MNDAASSNFSHTGFSSIFVRLTRARKKKQYKKRKIPRPNFVNTNLGSDFILSFWLFWWRRTKRQDEKTNKSCKLTYGVLRSNKHCLQGECKEVREDTILQLLGWLSRSRDSQESVERQDRQRTSQTKLSLYLLHCLVVASFDFLTRYRITIQNEHCSSIQFISCLRTRLEI